MERGPAWGEALAEIAPGPGSSTPSSFLLTQKLLFFSADDNSSGRQLWAIKVDGVGNIGNQGHEDKFEEVRKLAKHDLGAVWQYLIEQGLLDLDLNGILDNQ